MPNPHIIQCTGSARHPVILPNVKFNLLHDTLTGNSGLILVEYSGSHTFTITDNKSNTWTEVAGAAASGAQNQKVYYSQTMTAGTRSITVTPDSDANFMRIQFVEITDVSTVNTSGASTGTGTAASTNITTGASGCIIFHFTTQGTSDGYFSSSQITSGSSGFELMLTSTWDGNASQFGVQSGSGSITPSITFPSSVDWSSSVVALNATSAGTALPSGPGIIRVRRRMFYSMLSYTGAGVATNLGADATSLTIQFPRGDGSLVVHSLHAWNADANAHNVTGVSDLDNNNFYQAAVFGSVVSGTTATCSIWYSPNAKAASPFDTVTFSDPVGEVTSASYEVLGCNTSAPVGATSSSSGNDLSGPFSAGSITPTQTGSLIVVNMPVESSTVNASTSPSSTAFDGFWSTSMDGGFNRLEEDNGHAVYISPDTSTQNWAWTITGAAVNNWGIVLAEFLPAGSNVCYGTSTRAARPAPFKPGLPL